MLDQIIQKLSLPDLMTLADGTPVTRQNWPLRRRELIELICREEYGDLPPAPPIVRAALIQKEPAAFAGKASLTRLVLSWEAGEESFACPLSLLIPNAVDKPPVFLHVAFRPAIPDSYLPAEEVIDRGFAVATLYYEDISQDRPDGFSSGMAPLYVSPERGPRDSGKIALWAFAAMRVMDYLQTLTTIDPSRVAILGHSRLGKTALLAGGLDERFAYIIANESGCGGGAVSRQKEGEQIADICRKFPYWFCERYPHWAGREDEAPFDQHFLTALAAPRPLYLCSAQADPWSGPDSEYLNCIVTGKVYETLGLPGFPHPDRFPVPGDVFAEGSVGYHRRAGAHFLSREDWGRFMDFIESHPR